MDDTVLIAADAIVMPSRVGRRPLFEAGLDMLTTNLKQFYADPAKLKEAVQRFKQAGFTVVSVWQCGVSILGSKRLFEATFKARLLMRTNADAQSSGSSLFYVADTTTDWLIPPTQSSFQDLLDGIILLQPSQLLMQGDGGNNFERPPKDKDWYLYPEDIPIKLNRTQDLQLKKPIKIVVIDTGCDIDHPYFKGRNIKVMNSNHIDRKVEEADYEIKRINNIIYGENEISQEEWEGYQETIKPLQATIDFFKPNDYELHGTTVVANLVSIVPDAEIVVIKHALRVDVPGAPYLDEGLGDALRQAMNENPKIITISQALYVFPAEWQEKSKSQVALMGAMRQAIDRGIIIVLATGNSGDSSKDKISLYPQLCENLITVGGAYISETGALLAADTAHGYAIDTFPNAGLKNAVPAVCGLCGPDPGYIYCPVPSNRWGLFTATSLAAPQVAGVCAYICALCPTATATHVKEILMRTATPVKNAKTTQNVSLEAITHVLPNDEQIHPGLVHIKRATISARFLQNLFAKGRTSDPSIVKDAVDQAKALVGDKW